MMKNDDAPSCAHDWTRRPDVDGDSSLRFFCDRCKSWGFKRFGEPDRAVRLLRNQSAFGAYALAAFDKTRIERAKGAHVGGFNAARERAKGYG